MKIAIDTSVFLRLIGTGNHAGQQARDTLQRVVKDTRVVWTLHRRQLEELLFKTKELIEESVLDSEDQENAQEFYAFLLDVEQELLHRNPNRYRMIFGNPDGEDSLQNRKAAKACELADRLIAENRRWRGGKAAATVVTHAMLEKAVLLSPNDGYVEQMCSMLKALHRQALPPLWIQQYLKYREYPRLIQIF